MMSRTDALQLGLYEKEFIANQGRAPKLEATLEKVLQQLKGDVRGSSHP
jgi:hypothetical protein